MKKQVENKNALIRTTSLTVEVERLLSCSISFASAGIESWSLSSRAMANSFKKFAYNQLAAASISDQYPNPNKRPHSHAMIGVFCHATEVTQYYKHIHHS